jgi:hypothetical protein
MCAERYQLCPHTASLVQALFDDLCSFQYVIQSPTRTSRYNLPPGVVQDSILRAQEVPIGTMLRFQPLEVVYLIPEVITLSSLRDLVMLGWWC